VCKASLQAGKVALQFDAQWIMQKCVEWGGCIFPKVVWVNSVGFEAKQVFQKLIQFTSQKTLASSQQK
jgi:hypothetical protein